MTTEVTAAKQSRLGKRPIPLPKGVKITIKGSDLDVQGPKGKLKKTLPANITVKKEGENLHVTSDAEGTNAPRLQGLGRALVSNMVTGTAEGFSKILELVGTGYRAEIKGKELHLALGLSHPVHLAIPEGIEITIPPASKGTAVIVTGADKGAVGQFSADIKSKRPPEPYGGKGVRFRGEQIRRKAGKAGKGRK